MAKASKKKKDIEVDAYSHSDKKRLNNPPVGLVSTQTDRLNGKTQYQHDPHIDPSLSWAGKAEGLTFEVQNVSLHVHERIEPKRIIKSFLAPQPEQRQMSLFDVFQKKEPLHQAVEFYTHSQGWSNRLIAGDSLLVMNSLMVREGMAGKVQTIYIDPPYGIKYGSNFQPFVSKREVVDGNDADLTSEPETLKAFRDTWELGIHSYLTYLKDRLILSKQLLNNSGSIFVQISEDNLHLVRNLMDEVFGSQNFVTQISFATTSGFDTTSLSRVGDHLVWYAKSKKEMKYRPIFLPKDNQERGDDAYRFIELSDGSRRPMTQEERAGAVALPANSKIFQMDNLQSSGASRTDNPFEFEGQTFRPNPNSHWKASYPAGMERLKVARRIEKLGNQIRYVRYLNDNPVKTLTNCWMDTTFAGFVTDKRYVVETNPKVVQRCILMTTDPGDLVFDPTCGSGTTAFMAETWGRRWITCDTSRVSVALAKQRIMTARYEAYTLKHPQEGISSGFVYETATRVTLGSIANNEPPEIQFLYDQPKQDNSKVRVAGPFTVEAVPSLRTKPFDGSEIQIVGATDLSRTGETAKYNQWIEEIKATGIRGISGSRLAFSRIEPSQGTRFIHANAEMLDDKGVNRIAVISFGPDFGPLEQRQVEQAVAESRSLKRQPDFIIFAAFQFDPEAAKDIEEIALAGIQILKVQMAADLLTTDLRKKRATNESFWLIGQPDVDLKKQKDGKYQITVNGFDYYNPATGEISSGGADKIAMWMLDTNYDDRSLLPEQVFFPQGDGKRDWTKLAKSLNGLVDEEKLEAFIGVESLPFMPGDNRKIAVKIIDDRGIESFVIKKI